MKKLMWLIHVLVVAAISTTVLLRAGNAAELRPTIINSSPAFAGFEVPFFTDGDTSTDYASNGGGVGTFVDFDFGRRVTIADVLYTDRTSSGGANGSGAGGSQNNVTGYDLIFSDDNTFPPGNRRTVSVNSPGHANTDAPATINCGPGLTVRYVRFRVTAINAGSPGNVGGAEIRFFDDNRGAVYVDCRNPIGIPDFTQENAPTYSAAAAANVLWNWSAFSPFSNAARPLVRHRNQNDFAQNWPANSSTLVDELADLIYGPLNAQNVRLGGLESAAAMTQYINNRGYLRDTGANQNGLSVIEFTGERVTYAEYIRFRRSLTASAVGSWRWHDARTGKFLESTHTLTAAGFASDDTFVLFSNPWGDHSVPATNRPVSATYYDRYNVRVVGGRLRIYAADNPNPTVDLVHGARGTQNADYVELFRIYDIRQGGSPFVLTDVTQEGGNNRFTYHVTNPDSPPVFDFFLQVNPAFVSQALQTASAPPGWQAEIWNPKANEDLFGPDASCQPGVVDCQYEWNPTFTGIHWFTNSHPIGLNETGDFSFLISGAVPYQLAGVGLTAIGEQDNEVLYFNMAGGPVVPCDIDDDGVINRVDINAIFVARNTQAALGDPRDPDGDGVVTVNDSRICTQRCTNAQCAP